MPTRFSHADASIDGILCWDLFDFLDKAASQALAGQIVRMLRPGGAVMGFFCSTGVERAPFTKFEIVDDKTLRHRYHPGAGGKKVSLPNRDILRMFEGLVVADSFLLKHNTREMLLRKKVLRPPRSLKIPLLPPLPRKRRPGLGPGHSPAIHRHHATARQLQSIRRALRIRRQFQVVGAAEQRTNLARLNVGIGRHEPADRPIADRDLHRP